VSLKSFSVLILALVFITVTAVLLLALVSLAGNDLLATSNLQTQRSLEYAADGAVDVAVAVVRYTPNAFSTPAPCTPEAVNSPSSPAVSINSVSMVVYCQGSAGTNGRTVDFVACPGTVPTNYGACLPNAVLQANVSFIDWQTNDTPATGFGMVVNSWVVRTANG